MTAILLDTGPLVALLNRRDRHHTWIRDVLDGLEPPLYSCEPVITEACFLLRNLPEGQDSVLALVAGGVLALSFHVDAEIGALRELIQKYSDTPMSLADACLVRMSELNTPCAVLTTDSDFGVYRRHRRQSIPTIMPGPS